MKIVFGKLTFMTIGIFIQVVQSSLLFKSTEIKKMSIVKATRRLGSLRVDKQEHDEADAKTVKASNVNPLKSDCSLFDSLNDDDSEDNKKIHFIMEQVEDDNSDEKIKPPSNCVEVLPDLISCAFGC